MAEIPTDSRASRSAARQRVQEHIAKQLKAYRASRKMLQTELADRALVTRPTITRMECPKPRLYPTIPKLVAVAEALGLELVVDFRQKIEKTVVLPQATEVQYCFTNHLQRAAAVIAADLPHWVRYRREVYRDSKSGAEIRLVSGPEGLYGCPVGTKLHVILTGRCDGLLRRQIQQLIPGRFVLGEQIGESL